MNMMLYTYDYPTYETAWDIFKRKREVAAGENDNKTRRKLEQKIIRQVLVMNFHIPNTQIKMKETAKDRQAEQERTREKEMDKNKKSKREKTKKTLQSTHALLYSCLFQGFH